MISLCLSVGFSSRLVFMYVAGCAEYYSKDDSFSMNNEQDGARKGTLKRTLEEITKIYDLANKTGIMSLRFIDNPRGRKNVVYSKVDRVFQGRAYNGIRRIGTALDKKVLQPFVTKRREQMKKPLLIIVIADGAVSPVQISILGVG